MMSAQFHLFWNQIAFLTKHKTFYDDLVQMDSRETRCPREAAQAKVALECLNDTVKKKYNSNHGIPFESLFRTLSAPFLDSSWRQKPRQSDSNGNCFRKVIKVYWSMKFFPSKFNFLSLMTRREQEPRFPKTLLSRGSRWCEEITKRTRN